MIILTIKCFLVAWFISDFQPLQDRLDMLFFKWPKNEVMSYLNDARGCHKCLSFWITLGATWNPFFAIGAAMIALFLKKFL